MSSMANKAGWALALVLGLLFIMSAGRMAFGDGGALEPPGAPAPGMKSLQEVEPRTPISSIPYTITQPGSYYLTTNLTATGPYDGITVNVDNVSIDLGGYTLDGAGVGSSGILAFNVKRLAVRHGSFINWLNGIYHDGLQGRFEDLAVANCGVGLGVGHNSIVNSIVAQYNGYGVIVNGNSSVVTNVAVGNSTNAGIYLATSYNRVESNNAVANAVGIQILGPGNFVARNSATLNTVQNFSIVAGNFAPIESSPSVTNPWSNVNY